MTDNSSDGRPRPVGPDPSAPWGAPPAPGWAPPPAPPRPWAQPPTAGLPGPAPAPAPRSGAGLGCAFAAAGVALVAAVVFLAGVVVVQAGDDDSAAAADTTTTTTATPVAAEGERLAPAPPQPTGTGDFVFIETEADGDPAAWDPCDPIHYVVNSRRAPTGAEAILQEAITQVTAATGLVFVADGPTDEPPPVGEEIRLIEDPERYGDGVSPVLFTWTDVDEDPELEDAAGLALPISLESESGETVFVTGSVEIAGPYAQDLIDDGRRADVVGVVMHELGHLIGLDHVSDPTQVMTDDPESTPSQWGAGDLLGLYELGTGECVPDLP